MPLDPPPQRGEADGPPPARAEESQDLRSLVPPPMIYVPKGGWDNVFDVLAGNRDDLRTADGKPKATLISSLAGLDRSHLTQLKTLQVGIGRKVMAALVSFAMAVHGYTRAEAEAELFDLVVDDAPSVRGQVVSA